MESKKRRLLIRILAILTGVLIIAFAVTWPLEMSGLTEQQLRRLDATGVIHRMPPLLVMGIMVATGVLFAVRIWLIKDIKDGQEEEHDG